MKKNISINGKTYKIVISNVRTFRIKETKSGRAVGSINYDEQKIRIAGKNSIDERSITLLHEITHVIAKEEGLDIPEEVVERYSKRLHQVLKDNKLSF